jgi:hypothetical protein
MAGNRSENQQFSSFLGYERISLIKYATNISCQASIQVQAGSPISRPTYQPKTEGEMTWQLFVGIHFVKSSRCRAV